jgi:class 3 adenylate cyclase
MSCPQCRRANPPGAKFCSDCGAKLDAPCPACGHANAPDSRFCNACGAALGGAAPPHPPPASYTPPHLAARILTSRGALEGERKQVTVLLADLKGSMELLADRDPEEARRLLDPVLERMMEAVHYYEGTVNQVMGDGVMALFGAPLAHEDHALRACHAALRMQARIGQYGDEVQRTHGVPIQIRVGLNSGEVVVRAIGSDLHMDYTAVGQTTHLAARMEQMAKPGSVLMTLATLRLVEGWAEARPLGPVAVRGLGEPVEVFELKGIVGRTRLQVGAARGLTRFIGRDAELRQLAAALERAGGGHGQVVALVGEPGVGKSRLAWELARSHRSRGWLVLQSSAVSYGKSAPFLPVVELLRTYFGIEDGDDARRLREKITGRLLTLDEALRPALPALHALFDLPVDDAEWQRAGPGEQRRRMRDAVRRLLLRESEAQPLAVIVEDLHWADGETQAILESLVDSLASHRILLLVNYRPEYQHGWEGKSYYGRIRLDPMPPDTAETLLDDLLGTDAGLAPLRRTLVERAQGNPFFLEESVRALVEDGGLVGERGGYRLTRPVQIVQVPPTVQAILAARIDRLSPGDKSLLQAASVVGEVVPLALLKEVADLRDEDLGHGLARLQGAEFLYETRLLPEAEFTFKHAVTHEVAYASLLVGRRRALHARLVEAIERLSPEVQRRDRLMHHAFRGEVWSKALAYLRDPIEVASDAEVARVMGAGAESPGRFWWAGEHAQAIGAAERDLAIAASFGNFEGRVQAACRLAQAHHTLGNYARAAELLRGVVGSLTGDLARERFGMAALPSVWARSWLCWALAERGEFADGAAVGEEAARIAESEDDPYSRAQAAFGLGMVRVIEGQPEPAVRLLEEGLVVARVASIPFLVPFLLGPLGAAYMLGGDIERAVPLLEQAVEQGASMKLRAHHALRLAWLGQAHLLGDRRALALDHARRALEVARECAERGQQARALLLLADVAAADETADAVEAEALYRQAHAAAEALGMRPLVARCRLALGRLLARAGSPEGARAELDAAALLFDAMGMSARLVETRQALAAL